MYTTKRILLEIEVNFIVQNENETKWFGKLYVPASTVQATGITASTRVVNCVQNGGFVLDMSRNIFRQFDIFLEVNKCEAINLNVAWSII